MMGATHSNGNRISGDMRSAANGLRWSVVSRTSICVPDSDAMATGHSTSLPRLSMGRGRRAMLDGVIRTVSAP